MKGNLLVTILICVCFVLIFFGVLSYCWYARHVKAGVLFSKAMAPGQRRVGRERPRQRDHNQQDTERQAPLQVSRYISRGWSRARTRSRPREDPSRNPNYLIIEEARPGQRPRVTRYSPGRVAIALNYKGKESDQHRSKNCPQNDAIKPPEAVITKESIHRWASKTHPNGTGWENLSHGKKGEHPRSHRDEEAKGRKKESSWGNGNKVDNNEKAESHKKLSTWGNSNKVDHNEKPGSHKKTSSWGHSNKGDHNDKQPKGSTHSPKKAASKDGSKAISSKWTQGSKKVSNQQSGNEHHIIDRNSKNSDWGDSKKNDQRNDPDPWVSEEHPKSTNCDRGIDSRRFNMNMRAKIIAHKMPMSVHRGMLKLLAKRELPRQELLVRRTTVTPKISLLTDILSTAITEKEFSLS